MIAKIEDERVKSVTFTMYPSTIAMVKEVQERYGHRSLSAAIDFIVRDWMRNDTQMKLLEVK